MTIGFINSAHTENLTWAGKNLAKLNIFIFWTYGLAHFWSF